jgi:hypothetical protein
MPEARDPLRGTGRTTARILHAIAYALENPNKWVPFTDHAGDYCLLHPDFEDSVRAVVRRLGLHISVRQSRTLGVELQSITHARSAVSESPKDESEREKKQCSQSCDSLLIAYTIYCSSPGTMLVVPKS